MRRNLAKLFRIFFANSIVNKRFKDFNKTLYYERLQHLNFFFKRNITYESIIQKKISKCIFRDNLVFDVGGNIGQYALLFSELVGEKGKVISVEPDFKNYAFLNFNVIINKCGNVTCLNLGLGEESIYMPYFRDLETGGRMGSFGKKFMGPNFSGEIEQVQIKRFQDLLNEFGMPDFVKIDVEGFEANVLKGIAEKLTNTIFLIEVRDDTKEYVFNYFDKASLQCFMIDKVDSVIIKSPDGIPDFANLLFVPYCRNILNI